MRVVIHVGPHKTGTTSLQHLFAQIFRRDAKRCKTSDVLCERVIYPDSEDDACPYNHSLLASNILGINGYPADPGRLRKLVERFDGSCDVLLLSAEDFCKDGETGFERLALALSDCSDVSFLLGQRAFSKRATGLMQEVAIHELYRERTVLARPSDFIGHAACRIDYSLLLGRRFPDSTIALLDLDRNELDDSIVRYLRDHLGLKEVGAKINYIKELLGYRHNQRMDWRLVELLNFSKKLEVFGNEANWANARRRLVELYESMFAACEGKVSKVKYEPDSVEEGTLKIMDSYERELVAYARASNARMAVV